MKKLPNDTRPVVKSLYKDVSERCRRDNEILLAYFMKLKCFSDLQVSTNELLKGFNTISILFLPAKQVLFKYGQRGSNFYIMLGGSCQLYIRSE